MLFENFYTATVLAPPFLHFYFSSCSISLFVSLHVAEHVFCRCRGFFTVVMNTKVDKSQSSCTTLIAFLFLVLIHTAFQFSACCWACFGVLYIARVLAPHFFAILLFGLLHLVFLVLCILLSMFLRRCCGIFTVAAKNIKFDKNV